MRAVVFALVVAAGIAGQYATVRPQPALELPVYHYGSIYPEVRREAVEPPSFPGREVDGLYHPGETVPAAQVVVERARSRVSAHGGQLSRAELEAVLELAGWPEEWRGDAAAVAWCESRWSPYASGDGGNSLGLFQLWSGWFGWSGHRVDQWHDPVVNAATALAVVRRSIALGRAPWEQWSCRP